jgi:HWE histidine kinase
MLSTVQAVASQSFRNAGSMAQAPDAFEHRLMALSTAHDMLTRENWEGAGLKEIVAGFMAAHCADDDGQYTADGHETFKIAEKLESDGVPFLFATGYGVRGLPERFRNVPVLPKPFRESDMERALKAVFMAPARINGRPQAGEDR